MEMQTGNPGRMLHCQMEPSRSCCSSSSLHKALTLEFHGLVLGTHCQRPVQLQSSNYWAFRLALNVISEFYLVVSFSLTGSIPNIPFHTCLHLKGNLTVCFPSFVLSYSELPRLTILVNKFVQSASPSKTWEDEWQQSSVRVCRT